MVEFDKVSIGGGTGGKLVKKLLKSQKIVKKSKKRQRSEKASKAIGLEDCLLKHQSSVN